MPAERPTSMALVYVWILLFGFVGTLLACAAVQADLLALTACSGPSSTPSPGSMPFWSSTYNKTKAGTIKSAARAAATSTAVIVPDGAAACDTVSDSGSR